jgi:hypothetical protein
LIRFRTLDLKRSSSCLLRVNVPLEASTGHMLVDATSRVTSGVEVVTTIATTTVEVALCLA